MSEPVRLQIFVPEQIRRQLKSHAATRGVDMSDLGTVLLSHGLAILDSGKVPADILKGIEDARGGSESS